MAAAPALARAGFSVEEELAALQTLNINELRAHWSAHFNSDPPRIRSGDLMRRLIAEAVQVNAYGYDPELRRTLNRFVASHRAGREVAAGGRPLKQGSLLIRDWNGKTYRVEVSAGGFTYEGEEYSSLSVIARTITGSRWNGPRFFGLRGQAT